MKKPLPRTSGKRMDNSKKVLRNVKLTEDENKQLKRDAYAHGMNVSEYLRELIKKERERQSGITS